MNWSISREVNKEEIAWMAGIWDGEGCLRAVIQKNRKNGNPTLHVEAFVKNTDVLMIRKISNVLYKASIKFCFFLQKAYRDNTGTSHKKIVVIKVSGKGNVWKLLTLMFPYLITKRHQASLMLELIEYRDSLGYHGPSYCDKTDKDKNKWRLRCHRERSPGKWSGKTITDDSKIMDLIGRIQKSKEQLIDPSETKRIANRPLEIFSKSIRFA